MKTITFVLLTAVFASAPAHAQGVITLAPVPVTNGVTGTLASSSVWAALYYRPYGAPAGSFTPLVTEVALTNGYARFGSVVVPGYAAGTGVEVQIPAWDNSSGLYRDWTQAEPAWLGGLIAAGASMPVEALTGSVLLPPSPTVIPGFTISLVPEPSSAALGLLAIGLTCAAFRRKNQFPTSSYQ